MLRSFGEVRSVVRGASMVPTLFPGDIIVVRRETAQTARRGEVMLFFRQGFFCAHRLMDRTQEGESTRLIARGDALSKNDPPFAEDELLGRVTAVIRRGNRIELGDTRAAMRQHVLRWMVRRSGRSVKWLLRWHLLRLHLYRVSISACNPIECQGEGAI
ncbi:MAG TPA: S24/S26 family peptidase [Bryobacteraceae bacterium]|nr:S24/S26 family peptidase [Bryobacteraceae bacterium]